MEAPVLKANSQPSTPAPAPTPTQTQPANSTPPSSRKVPDRKPQGKVGHLPKTLRDRINGMLRDGWKQKDIIAQLSADAPGLTQRNISNWYHSPAYQLWLTEQQWREDLHTEQESGSDLLNDCDSAKFNQATLQLAITRLYRAFRHLDSGDLNQQLGGNAQSFARLLSALARACRETTNIEKFRQALEAIAARQRQAKGQTSGNPLEDIVREWDKAFGHKDPPPLPPYTNGNGNNPAATAVVAAAVPAAVDPGVPPGGQLSPSIQ